MVGSPVSPLPDLLVAQAETLERRSESVRAVTHSEPNRFTRAFDALDKVAKAIDAPLAIVGGMAAIRYGYPAMTDDIDVVASRDSLDLLLNHAPRFGLRVQWRSQSGWHTLSFEDIEINVVPEGGKARDSAPTTIPGPSALGVAQGLDYASLAGWFELKLSSGRQKDRTHLVEVLKTLSSEAIEALETRISQIDPGYHALLRQLRRMADDERQQEASRGRHRD